MTLSWWRGVHPLDPSRVPCYLAYLYVAMFIVCIGISPPRSERHLPPPRFESLIFEFLGEACVERCRWNDEGRLRTRARTGFKTKT